METPSTPPPEASDVLNANRTVIDEGTAPAATAAPSRSAIPTTPTPTRDAPAFDWRVLWPWAVAILLLLLIVYLLTRRRSSGGSSGGSAA